MLNHKEEFIHIPISEVLEPKDGTTVMMNRYWTEYVPGHISVYIGMGGKMPFSDRYRTYMPQSNRNEHIASMRGKRNAVFLPIVYFEDKQYE